MAKNKLYKITVKGVVNATLSRNCSPGITYVVASSIDKAYNAVLLSYCGDSSLGTVQDFDLDQIDVVASETAECNCANSYKLIMADTSYDDLKSKFRLDVENSTNSTDTISDSDNDIDEENNEDFTDTEIE